MSQGSQICRGTLARPPSFRGGGTQPSSSSLPDQPDADAQWYAQQASKRTTGPFLGVGIGEWKGECGDCPGSSLKNEREWGIASQPEAGQQAVLILVPTYGRIYT